MELKVIFYFVCACLVVMNFYYFKSTKHFIKTCAISGVSGLIALIPTGLVCSYLALPFAINYSTILISAILGIPGVFMTLIYTLLL